MGLLDRIMGSVGVAPRGPAPAAAVPPKQRLVELPRLIWKTENTLLAVDQELRQFTRRPPTGRADTLRKDWLTTQRARLTGELAQLTGEYRDLRARVGPAKPAAVPRDSFEPGPRRPAASVGAVDRFEPASAPEVPRRR